MHPRCPESTLNQLTELIKQAVLPTLNFVKIKLTTFVRAWPSDPKTEIQVAGTSGIVERSKRRKIPQCPHTWQNGNWSNSRILSPDHYCHHMKYSLLIRGWRGLRERWISWGRGLHYYYERDVGWWWLWTSFRCPLCHLPAAEKKKYVKWIACRKKYYQRMIFWHN